LRGLLGDVHLDEEVEVRHIFREYIEASELAVRPAKGFENAGFVDPPLSVDQ
jgi:hypothetical protein